MNPDELTLVSDSGEGEPLTQLQQQIGGDSYKYSQQAINRRIDPLELPILCPK